MSLGLSFPFPPDYDQSDQIQVIPVSVHWVPNQHRATESEELEEAQVGSGVSAS